MPVLATRVTTPTVPTPPPPLVVNPRHPLAFAYVDPDGVVWQWSDPASRITVETITGLGSPPPAFGAIALPGGGQLPQMYGAAPRNLVVGLDVCDESSQDGLLDLIDRLALSWWGERYGQPAAGTLIVHRPDGTARQIEVFCTSGPDQPDVVSSEDGYQWSTKYALTFVSALDPFFTDATATEVTFIPEVDDAGVPPMPPVLLQPAAVLGSATVMNSGSGPAFPIWTITGPGQPTMTLTSAGLSFGLDVTLDADEVVTIDTRPGRQSCVDQDGNDRWSDLAKSAPRDLWALPPGQSNLSMSFTSASADSRIVMSYVRRWLRA